MGQNLGYAFFKDIYTISPDGIKTETVRLDNLLASQLSIRQDALTTDQFSLFTTYPGLIMGVGLTHGVKDDHDFKIGFSFDHTTGQPVIPGSSVKGLLRSVFPNAEKDNQVKLVKTAWIHALIRGINDHDFFTKYYEPVVDKLSSEDKDFVTNLEKEIFDGVKDGDIMGIYQRDLFHDSWIASTNKRFLGTDYITPHYPDVLRNPVPVKFLKILPDIEIFFQFDLKPNKSLTVDERLKLFKKILLTIGIGAKTNVGYGRFTETSSAPALISGQGIKGPTPPKPPEPPVFPENYFPRQAIPYLLKNRTFNGVVSEIIDDYYIVTFDVKGTDCQFRKRKSDKLKLEKGAKVTVFCNNDYASVDSPNLSIRT